MIYARFVTSLIIFATLALNLSLAQQGRMGQQNGAQDSQIIDQEIGRYLNPEPSIAILTPGEFVEYTLKLKKDEVVIADAKSDAFDPALEVVDVKGNVLGKNDDRYPGDQRPLLFWRAPADGTYFLHVTSFQNRAGGSFSVRFSTCQSFGISSDKTAQYRVNKDQDRGRPILLRESLKAGELAMTLGSRRNQYFNPDELKSGQFIFENGLPVPGSDFPFSQISGFPIVLAPVSGDYYIFFNPGRVPDSNQLTNFWVQDLTPQKMDSDQPSIKIQLNPNEARIYEVKMKKHDFIAAQISGSDKTDFLLAVLPEPDLSGIDLTKQGQNPFFAGFIPNSISPPPTTLPVRPGDSRFLDFYAAEDETVWIASSTTSDNIENYTLAFKPAAEPFSANGSTHQKLHTGWTAYSFIPLNQGDIMTFGLTAEGFRPRIHIFDPSLNTVSDDSLPLVKDISLTPDKYVYKTEIETTTTGNYIAAISCVGDGGSGDYTLSGTIQRPKTLTIKSPGTGTVRSGKIQVWKFTVLPNEPTMLHLSRSKSSAVFKLFDFEHHGYPEVNDIDPYDSFATFNPDQPSTYTLIIKGIEDTNYTLTLVPVKQYRHPSLSVVGSPSSGKSNHQAK